MTNRRRRCQNHKCNTLFLTQRKDQDYCSVECRKAYAEWSRTRGSRVLRVLLSTGGDLPFDLHNEREALLSEIAEAKKNKA